MPDNVGYTPGSGALVATREVSYSGDTVQIQTVGLALTTGANDARTAVDVDSTNPLPVTEVALEIDGAAAQTATVNNILPTTSGVSATAVGAYRSGSVQVVSTGTGGTFIFEQSNDNTNFVALPVWNAALVTGVPITAAITASASQIIYTFPIRARFLRLRIATTITGGSIRAFTRLSTEPWTAGAQLVASNVAANLNATVSGTVTANIGTGSVAAGTNAIGDVGMQYRATATGAATPANLNCPATPAAQSIKASAGRLLSITATNSNAATRWLKVWNIASGGVTLGTTAALFEVGIPPNQTLQFVMEGGLAFGTAITVAVTGGQGLTNNTAVTLGDVTGFVGLA